MPARFPETVSGTGGGVTPAVLPYAAPITGTGGTITALTHGQGAAGLTVTAYESDGGEVLLGISISGIGDVTWSADETITGTLVIAGGG